MLLPSAILFQMRAAVMSFLRRGWRKVELLGETELASLGKLLCGLTTSEITRLDPHKLRSGAK